MTRLMILILVALTATSALAQSERPLFQSDFPPEEFAERRGAVYDAIGPNAVALLQGEPTPRGYVRFRQSNSFYYLSGVEVPHAYLLMDGATRQSTIFLPRRDDRRTRSEGPMLNGDEPGAAMEMTGVDQVRPLDALPGALAALGRRSNIRTAFVESQPAEGLAESRDLALRRVGDRLADPLDDGPPRSAAFSHRARTLFPMLEIADLSPILDEMRLIKSERELALIRRATRLSGLAIMEAMRSTEPGVVEHEIDALARFIYFRHGAQGDAYYSLVASGPNAPFPHYHAGARTMRSGELMLMDYAPDVGYYMSDVTRMIPVDGLFTDDHRALYDLYLGFYNAILYRIRPGVTPNQIKREAAAEMRTLLAEASLPKPSYVAGAEAFVASYERGAGSYGPGRLGHFVGMATHDVGSVEGELLPGMVFTIEPALRVPEEQLYIRLEDLIIITEEGAEIVSEFVPSTSSDIESLMSEPGLLQNYPKDLFGAGAQP